MARAEDVQGLNCQVGVMEGARLVLQTRFREMWALRDGALDWSDIEGVHDMRVASRRLRSAIQDFSGFLPGKPLRLARKNIRMIATALGIVRDLDVAIATLEEVLTDSPEELKHGLAAVIERKREERERRRRALFEVLTPDAQAYSESRFALILERRSGDRTARQGRKKARRELSFREAGRAIIRLRLSEIEKLSSSLYKPFEIEPLHDMRISAKRFRYAIELFSSCWGDALLPFAEEVARLQSELGEVHDSDEWIISLGRELATLRKAGRGETPEGENSAQVWLLAYHSKRRTKFFGAALRRWHRWKSSQFFSHLLEELDKSDAEESGSVRLAQAEQQS